MEQKFEINKNSNSLLDILPESFNKFLEENKINKQIFSDIQYLKELPRYIRIKPSYLDGDIVEKIADSLECRKEDIKQIEWNKYMFALKSDIKIVNSQLYQNGILYGIDLSSAAAVMALDLQPNESVLDLCCAPATKLCYIADIYKMQNKNYNESKEKQLIGVDISATRLQTSNNIINKYDHNDVIQLIEQDGTTYLNKQFQFDKVIVDAECTHDGSVKHLLKFINEANKYNEKFNKNDKEKVLTIKDIAQQKPLSKKQLKKIEKQRQNQEKQMERNNSNIYTQEIMKKNQWTPQDFEDRFMDKKKMNNILDLQYKLLENGFKNLKQGGILIYSTCTFAKSQNEDIVEKFINDKKNQCEIIPVFTNEQIQKINCQIGFNKNTVRFDPLNNKTGGMFIAKIKKI